MHQKDYFDPSKHIEPRIIELHEHKQRIFPQMKVEGCLHLTTFVWYADAQTHSPETSEPRKSEI